MAMGVGVVEDFVGGISDRWPRYAPADEGADVDVGGG
jgi:hypothetical protein